MRIRATRTSLAFALAAAMAVAGGVGAHVGARFLSHPVTGMAAMPAHAAAALLPGPQGHDAHQRVTADDALLVPAALLAMLALGAVVVRRSRAPRRLVTSAALARGPPALRWLRVRIAANRRSRPHDHNFGADGHGRCAAPDNVPAHHAARPAARELARACCEHHEPGRALPHPRGACGRGPAGGCPSSARRRRVCARASRFGQLRAVRRLRATHPVRAARGRARRSLLPALPAPLAVLLAGLVVDGLEEEKRDLAVRTPLVVGVRRERRDGAFPPDLLLLARDLARDVRLLDRAVL